MSIKFIDLFSGLGGIRLGFEQACKEANIHTECVLTSEIKPHAIETLKVNFDTHNFQGDLTKIPSDAIPDFDFLFAGFPCQPFSTGGKRHGFADTRGTLFFEIERILRDKQPDGFILENVEGLVKHDLESKKHEIGRTLQTILYKLENDLDYKVSWKVLDSIDFGIPQSRKRIFIVGTKQHKISLDNFPVSINTLQSILETGIEPMQTKFTAKLLGKYSVQELYGKAIKDKRGGENNIHSWDIGLKGDCTKEQIILLNKLFKERRKKHWANQIGIDWMDGMPLTLAQIQTFFSSATLWQKDYDLESMLEDLVNKGYLRFEHPKKLIKETTESGQEKTSRTYDKSKPKGYNIVTGKLSFDVSKILDPNDFAPTLVATDMSKVAVVDGEGIRRLTKREGLRLFGYPESYEVFVAENKMYDLLGNTVVVPVVKAIAQRLVVTYSLGKLNSKSKYVVNDSAPTPQQLAIF